jgi:hypothetical protein
MSAAVHGALQCVEYLLDNGASVDKRNFLGFSALHWTAYSARTEVVDLLIKHGADIDARTEDGKTIVHIAAVRGHLQYLEFIEARGADLNAVTAIGWSAVYFAVIGNFRKVALFLKGKGVDCESVDAQKRSVFDVAERWRRTWAREALGGLASAEDASEASPVKTTKKRTGGNKTPTRKRGRTSPKKGEYDDGSQSEDDTPKRSPKKRK